MSQVNQNKRNISDYIYNTIPLITIASLTFVLYCLGYFYLSGYVGRFGLGVNSLNFSTINTLQYSFNSLLIIFIEATFIYVYKVIENQINSKQKRDKKNTFTILVLMFSLALLSFMVFAARGIGYIILIFIVCINGFCTYKVYNLFKQNKKISDISLWDKLKRLFFITIFIVTFFGSSFTLGYADALEILGSNLLYTSGKIFKFEFKKVYKEEETSLDFKNKEFIYIIFANNNYYLFERQNPRPVNPIVYIIPKEEIKWMNIQSTTPFPLEN